jgi:hypothetical protein
MDAGISQSTAYWVRAANEEICDEKTCSRFSFGLGSVERGGVQ